MRCNWWRWLWGIVPLLVLAWVAVQAEHARLERDLSERSRVALAEAGLGWALTEFRGRDALLTGRAPQEGDPGKAAETLANLYGVRIVDNRAGLIDKADKYVWTASRRNNRIRLSGYAPSVNVRQAILGVTKASFPGFEVVDRTTLARGVPGNDVWLAAVSFALKQLTSLKRGDVRLEDLSLFIHGETEDVNTYKAVKQALASSMPKGLKVGKDSVMAPVVSPFAWAAHIIDGRLILSGYVPNEAQRAELMAAARSNLPAVAVLDRMEFGEGAPQGWVAAAIAGIRQLGRLESGGAEVKDTVLTITGLAADASIADVTRAALRAATPATMKLSDQIRVRELPPLPPAPPLPAPESSSPVPEPKPQDTAAAPPAPTAPAPPPAAEPVAVVKAKVCEDQLVRLAAAGQIIFALSSAELESASFPTLDKLADAAKTCPGMHIEVSGHASAEGDPDRNQQLSFRRAQSVVTYLVQAGVDGTQLEPVGYGSARPVAPNDTSENMAKNRRIEFSVRPK